jgi:hypothetical protein
MDDRNVEQTLDQAKATLARADRLLTVLELADCWRCHRNTIYTYIRKGILVVERIPGGGIRIRESVAAKCGPPPSPS